MYLWNGKKSSFRTFQFSLFVVLGGGRKYASAYWVAKSILIESYNSQLSFISEILCSVLVVNLLLFWSRIYRKLQKISTLSKRCFAMIMHIWISFFIVLLLGSNFLYFEPNVQNRAVGPWCFQFYSEKRKAKLLHINSFHAVFIWSLLSMSLHDISWPSLFSFETIYVKSASGCIHLPVEIKLVLQKVQNELLVVYTNQLLEKEHSGCRALLRDDKVLIPLILGVY